MARIFIDLLMGTYMGIHVECLPTKLDVIAKDISRVKKRQEIMTILDC